MIGMEGNGVAGLLLLALKGGVILCVTALAAFVLQRASATARHSVWFLGMVGLLVLPIVAITAPSWVVAVPANVVEVLPSVVVNPSPLATPATSPSLGSNDVWNDIALVTTSAASTKVAAPPAQPMLSRLVAIAFTLWAAGAALLLLTFFIGLFTLAHLERRSPRFAEGRVTALARAMALEMGMRGPVPVLRGMPGVMPMSWGLFRRVILLPEGAETWDETRLAAVLRHELAHVRRRDCLTQAVAEVSLALHWPNPLAWLAARRLRVEREHACDDAVVLAGARPSEYALALIELAESSRALSAPVRLAAAMARPVQLRWRLRAILDEERPRRGSPLTQFAAVAFAVALVAAVAAFTPAVDSTTTASEQAGSPRQPVASPAPVAHFEQGHNATDGKVLHVFSPPVLRVPGSPVASVESQPDATAAAELAQIRGRITDVVTGAPLRDGRVTRVGSEVVGLSSESGSYALIDIPAGTHELRVERVGYTTQTRTVALTFDATLETDFALTPDGNLDAQFQAELNRLRTRYETVSREPADTARNAQGFVVIDGVLIRSPLDTLATSQPAPVIYVDGIRVTNATIAEDRIERVEVIKGPAAVTLFGVDAANGVIQIFLKPEPQASVALQAIVPALDSLMNANPTRIRLRGESSIASTPPLLLIDGVRVEDAARDEVFASLKPDDIERIEIISGRAAVARYGEAAVSGVILVYRKRP